MQDRLWWISLAVLIATAVIGLLSVLLPYRRKCVITLPRALMAGVFLSGAVLFFALYYYDGTPGSVTYENLWRSILTALQHSMRLFVLDGGYMGLMAQMEGWDTALAEQYEIFAVWLYVSAPLTTFGFILTFVKNISSHIRYWLCRVPFWRSTHVFSEVNERTLALSRSIMENRRVRPARLIWRILLFLPLTLWNFLCRPVLVFCGVTGADEERAVALTDEARETGAILFRKELTAVAHGRIPARRLSFYLISDDEDAKLEHAAVLLKKNYRRARLYLFSDSQASRAFLRAYTEEEKSRLRTEVIRVDDMRALIYHALDENGHLLFKSAKETKDGRVISAAIVGMGRYGTEMLKALLWYCQIPGYTVHVTVLDESPDAAERFEVMCPDLVVGPHHDIPGDMRYHVDFCTVRAGTKTFEAAIRRLSYPSYVLVSLGNDELNVATALQIRGWMKDEGKNPRMETAVYSSSLKKRIDADDTADTEMANFGIHVIGDMESFYAEGTVIDSELVEEGLGVHERYGKCINVKDKNGFYMNDYNFYSSITKALHERLRLRLGLSIPGIDKPWEERTEEEKLAIGTVEHVRWNAYMRTEGYRYSGSRARDSRDHVIRLHNDLVPLAELSDEDLKKDA